MIDSSDAESIDRGLMRVTFAWCEWLRCSDPGILDLADKPLPDGALRAYDAFSSSSSASISCLVRGVVTLSSSKEKSCSRCC